MPAKLTPPIEETFDLPLTDKHLGNDGAADEATKVTIAQATQGQHDKRMGLWAEFSRSMNLDGDSIVTQRVSPADVRRLEVFLTLKSCNLLDEDGTLLFKPDAKEAAFTKAWNKLPLLVADEIHSKVLAVNISWSGEAGEEV